MAMVMVTGMVVMAMVMAMVMVVMVSVGFCLSTCPNIDEISHYGL